MTTKLVLPAVLMLAMPIWAVAEEPAGEPSTDEQGAAASARRDFVLYQQSHGPERGYNNLLLDGRTFDDFQFRAAVRFPVGTSHCGLVFRYRDAANFYRLVLRPVHGDLRVEKVLDGRSDYASTGHVAAPLEANRWYAVCLVTEADRIRVEIDGRERFSRQGFRELAGGRIGVTTVDSVSVEFDDVRVADAGGGETLFADDFNGDSLEGWTPVGPVGVVGPWALRPKAERLPMVRHFRQHYTFQVGPAMGRNQSMFEFPGITKLRDGTLLTLFVEENQHGTPPWAAMPSSGKLWMARSTDFGRTWTPNRPFLDTPLDDRHAYTLQLESGELLSFHWVQTVAFGLRGILNYTSRSNDGGMTWADPKRMRTGRYVGSPPDEPAIFGGFSLTVPPLRLGDGTLVAPVHCVPVGKKPPCEIGLLRSRDEGRTWGAYTTIATDANRSISFVEPALAAMPDGRWIVVTRTEAPIHPGTTHPYKLGPNMVCHSNDAGQTWTEPELLPLEYTQSGSTNPFLLLTATGAVVYAVNTGTAFSYDAGRTWAPQQLVCGYYPNLCEIAPGTVASLACGMSGHVFSLSEPIPGETPPEGTLTETIDAAKEHPNGSWTPEAAARIERISGMFRAVRVRGPQLPGISPLMAMPDLPLLAVAHAVDHEGRRLVAGLLRPTEQAPWSKPFAMAREDGLTPDAAPVLARGRDGTVWCAFSVTRHDVRRMFLTASRDGGRTWSAAAPMKLEGDGAATFIATSPPVETPDGSWAWIGQAGARIVLLGADRPDAPWRKKAELEAREDSGGTLHEPSLCVSRDGRWIVAACRKSDNEKERPIVVLISSDQGRTWTEPRETGIEGRNPEAVELLEDLFVVVAEDGDDDVQVAFGWDDLHHFIKRPLACAYCVRLDGRRLLARGTGVDVAGAFNNLPQVPLNSQETARAEAKLTRTIRADSDAFTFRGEWEKNMDADEGVAMTSESRDASVEGKFGGSTVALLHDAAPGARLLGVWIDGIEYPPVDMSATEQRSSRTLLADGLDPGEHTLRLRPLLRWRAGAAMTIRGLAVGQQAGP